jgi:hypothetical protein
MEASGFKSESASGFVGIPGGALFTWTRMLDYSEMPFAANKVWPSREAR